MLFDPNDRHAPDPKSLRLSVLVMPIVRQLGTVETIRLYQLSADCVLNLGTKEVQNATDI